MPKDPTQQAMSLLNRRAYSRRGIADKLRGKGYSNETIAATCDRLEAIGVLDDERYARQLIDETRRSKPAGSRLLKQKLYQRGISSAIIDKLLAEQTHDQNDQDELLDFARRKAESMRDLDRDKATRRLTALLIRRGFNPGTVYEVVRRVMGRDEG